MSKKFFVPGWDELSPVQKTLVEEWIKGVLQAQAAKESLIQSFFDNSPDAYLENHESFQSVDFKVVGDNNTLEEFTTLENISANLILDLPCVQECKRHCEEKFPNDDQGYRACTNDCKNNC